MRVPTRRHLLTAAMALLVAGGLGATVVTVFGQSPHVQLRFVAGWLCLSIAGFFVVALVQAELWRWLIRALGCRLDPTRSLAIWCVSAVARYAPTGVLMPVVRIRMSRARGVPASVCAASLVYEAVLAVCGALWVGSYFLLGLPQLHGAAWRWGVLLLPLGGMLALSPRGMALASRRLLARLRQEPLPVHLSTRQIALFTAGYAANFVLSGASLVALVLACHALPADSVPAVISAFAVGFTVSILGFLLPGSLGARELALVGALSLLMPVVVATAVAVVSRVIQLAIELLLGLLAPLLATRLASRRGPDIGPLAARAESEA
jgi:hypothetical protein